MTTINNTLRDHLIAKADNPLQSNAVLTRISIGRWNNRIADKKIANDVGKLYGLDQETSAEGAYYGSLIKAKYLDKLNKACNLARTYHYHNTLPWGDDDWRMLPITKFSEYSTKMREFESKILDSLVPEFLEKYPEAKEDAKKRKKGAYREEFYPTIGQLRKAWKFSVTIKPITDTSDFRITVQEEEFQKRLESSRQYDEQNRARAMEDLWKRLYLAIRHLTIKCSEPKAIFRDTMVGNIVELCDLLPSLNVLNDQKLEDLRKEVEHELGNICADDLRDDLGQRQEVAKKASSILSKISEHLGESEFPTVEVIDVSTDNTLTDDSTVEDEVKDDILGSYFGEGE